MNKSFVIIGAMVLTLSAPAGAEAKEKSKAKAKAKTFNTAQVIKAYDALSKKASFAVDKREELKNLVEVVMARKWFKTASAKKPVKGMFVYSAGEGGFIVKFMNGDGYASFAGSKVGGKIHVKAWSAGAQVGGSASWGVGLIMGLKRVSHFGGEYQGTVKGATAGDAASRGAVVLRKDGERAHEVALITVGRGLSAGVGGAKLTITPDW